MTTKVLPELTPERAALLERILAEDKPLIHVWEERPSRGLRCAFCNDRPSFSYEPANDCVGLLRHALERARSEGETMRSTRRQKPEINLFTHRCPVGHEWKSMLANAKNCPECRREQVRAEAPAGTINCSKCGKVSEFAARQRDSLCLSCFVDSNTSADKEADMAPLLPE